MTDDLDERYRRESQADPSRPSERARRSVLEHAAQLAEERGRLAVGARASASGVMRTRWWRSAMIGTLAAAALAGLIIVPRLATSPGSGSPIAGLAAPENRAPPPTEPGPVAEPRAPMSNAARAADSAAAQAAIQRMNAMAPRAARPEAASPGASVAESVTALAGAAEHGDVRALEHELAQGVDINARDAQGRTALLRSVQTGQAASVVTLLAHGADPNVADASGMTPLQSALAAHRDDIAASLRRAGAR